MRTERVLEDEATRQIAQRKMQIRLVPAQVSHELRASGLIMCGDLHDRFDEWANTGFVEVVEELLGLGLVAHAREQFGWDHRLLIPLLNLLLGNKQEVKVEVTLTFLNLLLRISTSIHTFFDYSDLV